MIRKLVNEFNRDYNMKIASYKPISTKSFCVTCNNGLKYFFKKTNLLSEEKYQFLNTQGIENIVYPIKNLRGEFVSRNRYDSFYLMNLLGDLSVIDEIKAVNLKDEITNLHFKTNFKRQLSVSNSRYKMEELFEYLQYKFNVIESFVRTIESRPFDEFSITILKNYKYILDAKKVMGRIYRKLISNIKDKKSVYYSFIHNNPKLNHILYANGKQYLTSIENAKIGISSLDLAKYYVETEDLNIDANDIILNYFSKYEDDFYKDYFYFIVLLYYLKSIVIIDKDYVSSQSFIYAGGAIKKFLNLFNLSEEDRI